MLLAALEISFLDVTTDDVMTQRALLSQASLLQFLQFYNLTGIAVICEENEADAFLALICTNFNTVQETASFSVQLPLFVSQNKNFVGLGIAERISFVLSFSHEKKNQCIFRKTISKHLKKQISCFPK